MNDLSLVLEKFKEWVSQRAHRKGETGAVAFLAGWEAAKEHYRIDEKLTAVRAVEAWVRERGDPTGVSGDYGTVHATTLADKLAKALGDVKEGP